MIQFFSVDMKGEREGKQHAAKGRRLEPNLQPLRRGLSAAQDNCQVKSSQNLLIQHYLYRQADQCALQSNRISHDRQNKKN